MTMRLFPKPRRIKKAGQIRFPARSTLNRHEMRWLAKLLPLHDCRLNG
jgi:uncharacterized protein YfaT (DUF1175 family)